MLPRHVPVFVLVLILTFTTVLTVFGRTTSFIPPEDLKELQEPPEPMAPPPQPQVLIGAGDISVCGIDDDQKTARIIDRLIEQYPQAEIFTAGDNAQSSGAVEEYTSCFDKSWGRFKNRIHPSPGNHDWYNRDGEGYFDYFGATAGKKGLGYYSYNLGVWHIVSLNSNCDMVDCGPASAQVRWLLEDLEKNKGHRCTLLYWHHPIWDSGTVKIMPGIKTFWDIASAYNAEIVVNGHDHHYERFAPLGRNGIIDSASGIREFIAGTGGAWLFDLGDPLPATQARDNTTHGVIKFTLYPNRYTWEFIPVEGEAFEDSGSDTCH